MEGLVYLLEGRYLSLAGGNEYFLLPWPTVPQQVCLQGSHQHHNSDHFMKQKKPKMDGVYTLNISI
eukprot:4081153-Pyramimonas_sp.AAC.1